MPISASPIAQSILPHLHIAEEVCPWCEQSIPRERLKEITRRMEARAKEQAVVLERGLREQFAREKAKDEVAAQEKLQNAQSEHTKIIEALKNEAQVKAEKADRDALVREAAIRTETKKATEAELNSKILGLESARAQAETAKAAAEARLLNAKAAHERALAERVATARKEVEASVAQKIASAEAARVKAVEAKASADARVVELNAAHERTLAQRIAEVKREAEATATARLAQADAAKSEAEKARVTAEAEVAALKAAQEAAIIERVAEVREALGREKTAALLAEQKTHFEEQQRLKSAVHDLQRKLENRKASELGEGAEIDLFEKLKEAFQGDRFHRVAKGVPGADIIHEIIENGQVCGKIIYDSKNRNAWQASFATKLRDDMLAAKGDHAILSTNKFPAGARELHLLEGVILACPARVLTVVEMLRTHIVRTHGLRASSAQRAEKQAALYDFITSERFGQLADCVDSTVEKLEELDAAEKTQHDTVWKKRGTMLRTIVKSQSDLGRELNRILGIDDAS